MHAYSRRHFVDIYNLNRLDRLRRRPRRAGRCRVALRRPKSPAHVPTLKNAHHRPSPPRAGCGAPRGHLVPVLRVHDNAHCVRVHAEPLVRENLLDIFFRVPAREHVAEPSLCAERDGGGDCPRRVSEAKVPPVVAVLELYDCGNDGEYEEADGEEVDGELTEGGLVLVSNNGR